MCAVHAEPTIRTRRLTLRRPRRADLERIVGLIDDFDIARMTTRIPHPYSRADAEAFWSQAVLGAEPGSSLFVIDEAIDGAVGVIGLDDKGSGRLAEVGYWLAKPWWNQGLASEALEGLLDWASEAGGRRALMAGHFADNLASARVLEKAGFIYTGDVQPRFSLARGEVAPTRMMLWMA